MIRCLSIQRLAGRPPLTAPAGPRRIMAKPDSLQGSIDLLVLKILSRRPGLHGYALMTAIHDISREVLSVEEGSLYPALHRMEEAGWIRAEWMTKDSGRRARVYELTAAGKKQLGAEELRWQAVTSAVNRVLRTV
jgi:PadR family transcriptional regulator PadR